MLSFLGIALFVIVALALLVALTSSSLARILLVAALIGLWAVATPIVARSLSDLLEDQNPPRSLAGTPTADVVVVLGGGTLPAMGSRQTVGLSEHGDRLLHAFDLYRADKAKAILVSGGNVDGQYRVTSSEAAGMRDVLERLGVPADAIVAEDRSRDTRENAINSVALIRQHGWTTALLVTSAIHMPRAMAAFAKASLTVIPSAADLIGAPTGAPAIDDWLPSASALAEANNAAHEMAALLYYRLRGWI